LGKVSIAVKTFGVCDFSRLAVTDWRLRRWRLWFLALMKATRWQLHRINSVNLRGRIFHLLCSTFLLKAEQIEAQGLRLLLIVSSAKEERTLVKLI